MTSPTVLIVLFILSFPSAGCGKKASNAAPDNAEPMYGGQYEPSVPPSLENSVSAIRSGWEFYYQGDYETAMKRFNQAWMFDRNSVGAFWGFGLVQGQRAKVGNTDFYLNDSVRHLKRAAELDPGNIKILVDLAYSHTVLGGYASHEGGQEKAGAEFAEAGNILRKVESMNAAYPPLYFGYSVLGFYSGNATAAKVYLEKAKSMGYKPDPAFEAELEGKLKE